MNFALIIALLFLAANVHQYICDDSTNHEDFQTSFPSQLTRNPPPFPNLSVTKKNKMMPTKPHSITLLYLLAQAGDLHPNPGPNSSIPLRTTLVAPVDKRYMTKIMLSSVTNVTTGTTQPVCK